jgi:DNA-directed RNA polymerase specialized sigma24 family protein
MLRGHRPRRRHRHQARLAPPACTPVCNVVTAALSSLPAEYSSVIVETFYRGRSVQDTADLLGVSADTVRVRCYDGLRALKHELAERGLAQ